MAAGEVTDFVLTYRKKSSNMFRKMASLNSKKITFFKSCLQSNNLDKREQMRMLKESREYSLREKSFVDIRNAR